MLFGYARPSTTDPAAGLAAQEQTLKAFGVERIFTEPGASLANRPVLKVCLGLLRENDALIVTTPDRLAAPQRICWPSSRISTRAASNWSSSPWPARGSTRAWRTAG